MVVAAGVEPAISWMRTRRPRPLDDATTRIILSLFGSIVNSSSGSTGARRYPLSYVYSGVYYWLNGYGLVDGQNSRGYWWSITANSAGEAYFLYTYASFLDPQYSTGKTNGQSLRSTITRRYPLSYVFSGQYYWVPGSLLYQNTNAGWWSTTAGDASNAYNLGMGSSALHPQVSGSAKTGGFPLRCVSE